MGFVTGYFDASLLETSVYFQMQASLERPKIIVIIDVEAAYQVQRTVAEATVDSTMEVEVHREFADIASNTGRMGAHR